MEMTIEIKDNKCIGNVSEETSEGTLTFKLVHKIGTNTIYTMDKEFCKDGVHCTPTAIDSKRSVWIRNDAKTFEERMKLHLKMESIFRDVQRKALKEFRVRGV